MRNWNKIIERLNNSKSGRMTIQMGTPGSAQVTRCRLLKDWSNIEATTHGAKLILRIALVLLLAGSASAQSVIDGPDDSRAEHMSPNGLGAISLNLTTGSNNNPNDCAIFELNGSITQTFASPLTNGAIDCAAISDGGLMVTTVEIGGGVPQGRFETATTSDIVLNQFGAPGELLHDVSPNGQIISGRIFNPNSLPGDAYYLSQDGGLTVSTPQGTNLPQYVTFTDAVLAEDGGQLVGRITQSGSSDVARVEVPGGTLDILPFGGGCSKPDIDNAGKAISACSQVNPLNTSQTQRLPQIWEAGSQTPTLLPVPACSATNTTPFGRLYITGDGMNATGRGCAGNVPQVWISGLALTLPFESYLNQLGVSFDPGVTLLSVEGFNSSFDRFIVSLDDNGIDRAAVVTVPSPTFPHMIWAGVLMLGLVSGARAQEITPEDIDEASAECETIADDEAYLRCVAEGVGHPVPEDED